MPENRAEECGGLKIQCFAFLSPTPRSLSIYSFMHVLVPILHRVADVEILCVCARGGVGGAGGGGE